MPKEEDFSPLGIISMRYVKGEENYYLVYSDKKNFINVNAQTAFEAIEKSGIAKPYKIVHGLSSLKTIVQENEIIIANEENKPKTEETFTSETN